MYKVETHDQPTPENQGAILVAVYSDGTKTTLEKAAEIYDLFNGVCFSNTLEPMEFKLGKKHSMEGSTITLKKFMPSPVEIPAVVAYFIAEKWSKGNKAAWNSCLNKMEEAFASMFEVFVDKGHINDPSRLSWTAKCNSCKRQMNSWELIDSCYKCKSKNVTVMNNPPPVLREGKLCLIMMKNKLVFK